MDKETALKILSLKHYHTSDDIQENYLAKVKQAKEDANFEAILKELNVARDTLVEERTKGQEIVPYLAKEISRLNEEKNRSLKIQDARENLKECLDVCESRAIAKIHQNRDTSGFISAISAGTVFVLNNIEKIPPEYTLSPSLNLFLVGIAAVSAGMAYLSHRRAKRASDEIKSINQALSRQRSIERILNFAFGPADTLGEIEFEERLTEALVALMGMAPPEASSIQRIRELYATVGLPLVVRPTVDTNFVDEYIDFMLKSGNLMTSGSSGLDLQYRKMQS
ncbi:MAG: hypothetical protein ABJP34_03605 [Erythrobacter sp.]